MKIWLPDNQTVSVDWYVTDQKKALGVNEIREEWAAREVLTRPIGFWVGDPERDSDTPEFRA